MTDWKALGDKYYLNTGKRQPITLVRGEGVRVWDDQGKEYLDFVAGWAVNTLGHCHPVMVSALAEQARTLFQVSNQFYTVPQLRLAELLIQNSCLDRIFFANSGAEACEGAVKLARRYGKLHRGGAYEVITALDSFHGRTLAMTAATGQKKFHDPYEPLPGGFVNVEFNSIEAIKNATTKNTCAVMLEPVQGEGGVNIPSDDYLRQVRAWCDEQNLLLILDEVQTGLGRLGALFGYQLYGVEPDIMTLAKGLGGGVPISCLLAKEKASVFVPGEHGSTYGGNPLLCATAYAVVKYVLEHDLPAQVRRVGQHLREALARLQGKYSFIREVRGRGLLIAVEFDSDLTEQVMPACHQVGLLLNPVKPNAVRLMPPLVLTEREADRGVELFDRALAQVSRGLAAQK